MVVSGMLFAPSSCMVHSAAVGDLRPGPLQMSPALCVFARQCGTGDPLCERICPTQAIRVEPPDHPAPGPVLDSRACVECHLCARACPVGVFEQVTQEQELEAAIRRRIRHGHNLLFRCRGRHPLNEAQPRAAGVTEIEGEDEGTLSVPCLGAVSAATLVLASALGAQHISFDTRQCGGCGWRRGLALARRAARQARRILQIFDREAQLSWGACRTVPTRTRISRREFLNCGRRGVPEETSCAAIDNASPAVRRPPRDRLLLAGALRLLGAPSASVFAPGDAPLWAIVAADTCDSCGVCAALCPTEALRFRELEGEARILFRTLLCTGCGICLQKCPRQALQRRSLIPSSVLVESGWITLARSVRERCRECGRQVWEGGGRLVCSDCRVKQALALSFSNVRVGPADAAEGAR